MNDIESSTKGPRKTYCHRRRGKRVPRGLEAIEPNAAGIDVGARAHYVSVPEDRDPQPVQCFGCFTPQLEALARWLLACGIRTVVLESTGVYWIPVYRVLEAHGLDVRLVDARHVKYVPGRKTDVADCQWLRQLHTFGLLAGAFVPPQRVAALRAYWRQRRELIESCSREIEHMQKALTQMNLHLHVVLSDITGVSGLRILRAIVQGERDPLTLARLAHPSVQRGEEEFVQALTGHYTDEQVFILTQALELYDVFQEKIQACDRRLGLHLADLPTPPARVPADAPADGPADTSAPALAKRRASHKRRKNEPHFDLRAEVERLAGVDLTRIDGVDAMTAFTVCSEIGFDVSAFATDKHFASWLGLCPNNTVTGGRVKRRRTRRTQNRAAHALRLAAQSLHRSDSYLGAYYRRLRSRLGAPKAITATAHKLSRLIYALLKHGHAYVDRGQEHFEQQHRARTLKNVVRRARELGLEVVDLATGEILTPAV